jgi:hypothetical protein
MDDLGRTQSRPLLDALRGVEATGARGPAHLRVGTMVAATALLLVAGAGLSALEALDHRPPASPVAARPMAARPVADLTTPAPAPAVVQLTVGPGSAGGFGQFGQWNAEDGGAPGFVGPSRWVFGGEGVAARWSLGSPAGGRGWDQVRVLAWIPDAHALAWVRYAVTSTEAGVATVRTFDVSQQALNGWYQLPASFAIGSATERTGSITVDMTYLRPYAPTAANGGCEMAAAQVQFVWS